LNFFIFAEKMLVTQKVTKTQLLSLGFGFAPYTGGPLSWIDMLGAKRFVDMMKALEKKHGARFKPAKLLVEMAAKGDTFYRRFGTGKTKAAA